MKPGWQTTEFYLTVLGNVMSVWSMVSGSVDPKTGLIVTAILNGAYTVMRTLAKSPEITTLVKTGP